MTLPDFDPDFGPPPSAWAAMYRACRLQVVPCHMPNEVKPGEAWKRPKLADWGTFQTELANDAVFASWYDPDTGTHRDRPNMGMITGHASDRVMVVDLDIHKKPEAGAWWHQILEVNNHGLELETVEQITGGGGRQKLFRYPEGWRAPTNRTAKGVDIRGEGGFAVLPPSVHESRQEYAWAPGRAPWEVEIADAPTWLLEEIESLVEAYPGAQSGPKAERTESPGTDYTAFGSRQDGRETEMRDTVWRHILEWYRQSPIPPTETEILAAGADAYLEYEAKVVTRLDLPKREGLEQEGRGPTAFMAKWRREIRHWGSPKMREHAARPNPNAEEDLADQFASSSEKAEEKAKADPGLRFGYLNTREIKLTPDPVWLIEDMVPEKVVGFIFGPPASLKTFIALDMALSMATGQPSWWGRQLSKPGAVVYISSEGIGGLKYRLAAWEQHRKCNTDDRPFYLIRETINFMKGEDHGKLLATIQAIKDEAGCDIAAVFVDTVSRVLPGAEENQQKDMSLFVGACDAVRQKFDATVIGIHHSNKQGGMRGSTVIPAAGDFVLEVEREAGSMVGKLIATKIKDAVDGWAMAFKVTEIHLGTITPRTSLVVDVDLTPPAEAAPLPPKDVLRRIIIRLHDAWVTGKPWSASPQSQDRYMPRLLKTHFDIPHAQGKYLMQEWLANDVLSIEEVSAKSKLRGLKVTGSID